jgi:hypothetical protein
MELPEFLFALLEADVQRVTIGSRENWRATIVFPAPDRR